MFLILLHVQGHAQPCVFKFKGAAAADKLFASLVTATGPDVQDADTHPFPTGYLNISDDYGHRKACYAHHVLSVERLDFMKDLESQQETAVAQAKAQAAANRAVQNDPGLRLMGGIQPQPPFLAS